MWIKIVDETLLNSSDGKWIHVNDDNRAKPMNVDGPSDDKDWFAAMETLYSSSIPAGFVVVQFLQDELYSQIF
jgi:hypothetical protein